MMLFLFVVLLCLAVAPFVAVCGLVVRLLDRGPHRIRYLLGEQRSARIRDVADGQVVKVRGRIRLVGEPLKAPLSGRPCVCYQALQAGEPRRAGIDFLLEDGTGKAIVNAALAEVDFDLDLYPMTALDKSDYDDDVPASATSTALVPRLPPSLFQEGLIAPGDWVAVSGLGHWEADPEPDDRSLGNAGYRETPRRLVITGGHGRPVCISNDPRVLD